MTQQAETLEGFVEAPLTRTDIARVWRETTGGVRMSSSDEEFARRIERAVVEALAALPAEGAEPVAWRWKPAKHDGGWELSASRSWMSADPAYYEVVPLYDHSAALASYAQFEVLLSAARDVASAIQREFLSALSVGRIEVVVRAAMCKEPK